MCCCFLFYLRHGTSAKEKVFYLLFLLCCCFLFYLRHGTSAKEKVSASIISSVLLLSFHLRHGTSAKEKVSASIISSVLLLSFHLRQGTSAKEKVFLLFLLSCCFLSIFTTIRAPKKGKFLSVCEVESNVCRKVCVLRSGKCLVKNLHCVSSVCSGSYDWKKSFSAQEGEPLVKASVCNVQWLIYGKTLQCVRGVWVDWRVCVMVHVLKKIQCV
jgi:hypothetical protein